MIYSLDILVQSIESKIKENASLLVGISGIDGSGKGYVAAGLEKELRNREISVVLIGIDGWLNPPSLRFSESNPSEHFYNNGFRFQELHDQLFTPLRNSGIAQLTALHSAPDDSEELVKYNYNINSPKVIIFEGIFLFQDLFDFDYKIWIECSFEKAFERALVRNQEGITPERMKEDYETIYHAAQRIHFEKDSPQSRADIVFFNDN